MKTQMDTRTSTAMPADPYDIEAWLAFYDANPGHRRSVGAAGDNDEGGGEGDDDNTGDGETDGDDTGNDGDEGAEGDGEGDAGGADTGKNKPSDKEAQLLKDMMKHKDAAKKAKAEAAAKAKEAADLQKRFDGIDPEKVRKLLADQAKAEEDAALARGEFDKVRAQMAEQHKKTLSDKEKEVEALRQTTSSLEKQIQDLTIGTDFGNSKFLTDETVLSPRKARTLYGDHFDIVEGKVVGYDQPRGVDGRSPIVDSDGNPVAFDAAIRKIVETDPDKDTLLRANMKPGAGSSAAKDSVRDKGKAQSSLDKISEGLKGVKK